MHRRICVILLFLAAAGIMFSAAVCAGTSGGMHSSELEKVVSDEGNRQKTEYYYNGKLTFAADRHFATMIRTIGDDSILEEYYDENGDPVQQPSGHYALLREYDDKWREIRLTYLDADGQPVLNTSGYSTAERIFNDSNQVEFEHYYDAEGQPVSNVTGYYGFHNIYKNDRPATVIYLDEKDRPIDPENTLSGYSIVRRTFYESGPSINRLKIEHYYDQNDKPIALSLGQYGLRYEYDELGRADVLTYLGKDGTPAETNRGYAIVKRTFKPDNTPDTDMYYDADGNQTKSLHGQYGIKYVDGKQVFLDENGEEYFSLYNHISNYVLTDLVIAILAVAASIILGRRGNLLLLVLYLGFIVYMTLMFRPESDPEAQLELFWSYKQFFSSPTMRQEIISNILLFIPLGSILYKCIGGKWTLPAALILSACIEITQYHTGLGLAEFDDVISNGLGALTGLTMAAIAAAITAAVDASARRRRSDR